MSKRVYDEGTEVYVGNDRYTVDAYEEGAFWNPKTHKMDIPGYLLYDESDTRYFANYPRTTVHVHMVHHLSLSERVLRIEERLGLDDEGVLPRTLED